MVQAETRGGADLVRYMLALLHNEKKPDALRIQAVQWLADRGFGKAVVQVDAQLAASVDATVSHVEALRSHVREEDVDRLVAALLGDGAGEDRAGRGGFGDGEATTG
jgi:hypothetical protein